MLDDVIAAVTAGAALTVLYHHAVYPVLLRRWGKGAPLIADDGPDSCRPTTLPKITILIPAYQEASAIADKIRNLATLDYPADRLSVVIACDGCTDATADRARMAALEPECAHLSVTVHEFPANRGKVAVLNAVIPTCEGDIVGLSDVTALLSIDCLQRAAMHFASDQVAVACATYRMLTPGSAGEAAYWRYQVCIKEREAALGAPLGAHGAFYLFRRSLFKPLAADTINDDFVLPMDLVAAGYRAVYDPDMVAVELECANDQMDWSRRVRIAAGNVQQAVRLRNLLLPRHGGIAFAFLSGKALRATMPFLMLAAFLGAGYLASASLLFAALFAGQAALYTAALVAVLLPRRFVPGPLDALRYLVTGHLAGLVGAIRYLIGLERGRWRRAPTSES